VSQNHRTTAAKVTAQPNIHLEDHVYKTVQRELHNSNIHGRAAIAKPLLSENNAKRQKRLCDDKKLWPSDDWIYVNMIRWVILQVVPNIRVGLCVENAQ